MSKEAWERDKEWSEQAMPLQDKVYHYLWSNLINIKRFPKEGDRHILDKEYHIDVEITLENGATILGQEKMLRGKFASYDTFTIEFYQDCKTKEKGEFFSLAAQFYLHGYAKEGGEGHPKHIVKWYMIKVFDFLEWLSKKPIEELEKTTRVTDGSRASFFYIKYSDIPKEFIFEYYEKDGPDKHIPKKDRGFSHAD